MNWHGWPHFVHLQMGTCPGRHAVGPVGRTGAPRCAHQAGSPHVFRYSVSSGTLQVSGPWLGEFSDYNVEPPQTGGCLRNCKEAEN